MSKILRGLRGATTAAANTGQAILDATAELLRGLQEANGFQPVPLLGAAEVAVPDGVPRCIRVLLHFYTAKPQRELKHMYLRDAAKLRPDRKK